MDAPQTQEKKTLDERAMVEFQDSRGDTVKLSPSIVTKFITGNNANITLAEFKFFSELCRARKLNPFLKEAYCIKYGTQPATIVVSKDVYVERADAHPDYDGKESGLILQDKETGEIKETLGCFYNTNKDDLLGAWCKVYRKSRNHPEYMSVAFSEVAQRKSNGELNSNWRDKPATMCEKVAVVRALRAAFPQEFSQMYIENEMPDLSPVEPTQKAPKAQKPKNEPLDVDFADLDDIPASEIPTEQDTGTEVNA